MAFQGCQGQEPVVGCWMSLWALVEFGKCLIPLNACSVFLTFIWLIGLIHLLSFPEHLALDTLVCWGCCWSRTLSAHQTPPGEAAGRGTWELYFSHLVSFLGALLPQQMAFLSCFWKVHMAYKREYLFNCKTWPPVLILMSAVSIHLHISA